MDLTVEQQRAIAVAQAKRRRAEAEGPKMGTGEDVARSLATGVGEGVTGSVGLLGDVQSLGDDLGTWIGDQLGLPRMTPEQQQQFKQPMGLPDISAPTTAEIEKATTFDQHKHTPQTTAGQFARTTGQMLPAFVGNSAVVAGPGKRLVGAGTGVIAGTGAGVGSEAAGQLTEGTPLEVPARMLGAVGGGFSANVLARRAVTPRNIPPERHAAAQTLRNEGIDNLTEGQISGNKNVLARERKAAGIFSDNTARSVAQREKLTQAALAKVGVLARRATPDVMDDAFTKLGKQFDDLASRNSLTVDSTLSQDIRNGIQEFMDLGPSQEKVAALRGFITRVGDVIDPQGVMDGKAYKSLRSAIERAARGSTADPDYARALRSLKDSLDNAMERSMVAAGSPDVGAWRDVRKKWRNILVIDDALGSTGADAAEGLLNPQTFRQAVKRKHGARNMVRGKGDFEELSRAASIAMPELPLTGTAPLNPASIWQSGLAFPAELLTRLGRDIRMSKPVQRYLTNRVAPPPPASPVRNYTPAVIPPFSDLSRERQK